MAVALPTPNAIFTLDGRRALVTGSTRGIGKAIARALAGAGAHVIVHGTRQADAETAAEAIRHDGGKADAIAADLSEQGAGRRLMENVETGFGPIDILVINASAQRNAELDGVTDGDLQFQIDVNITAAIGMLQTCLPQMAERGWGRVIGVGSINQSAPKPIVTAYAMTKAAQHNLIQSQARAYAGTGVVLNTLAPGLIDTDRNADRKDADPEAWSAYCKSANWMSRSGRAEEMSGAALFLSSDACSFMTGECITLSGGT